MTSPQDTQVLYHIMHMYETGASDGDDNTEYSCTSNMQTYVVQDCDN